MSLLKKFKETFGENAFKQSFDKQLVIEDILYMLEHEFPDLKVISATPNDEFCLWDIMIVRSVVKSVKTTKGSMQLYESVSDQLFQEIIVVNVLDTDEEITKEMEEYSKGWTKYHFIVSDDKSLRNNLIKIM
jgi:hypothetical protein